ncbi:response regulator transcription factor [Cryomorphaceae bacterium]|nr:response regulator transcription factor [Cryomorphaceae bacterium]
MKKVLVVEDDQDIRDLITLHLEDMDCTPTGVGDGNRGLQEALTGNYDLVLLDLMLPGTDGISICQKMRALEVFTPVMMLTARSEEFDKVLGLESGADDYLTKPFGIREMKARVKALLRREERLKSNSGSERQRIERGGLLIDLEQRKVEIDGERIELTPKEYELLVLLADSPGQSFSREQLLLHIWGYEFKGYEHTVNSHINRLRTKIDKDKADAPFILTTWGVGYRFNDQL